LIDLATEYPITIRNKFRRNMMIAYDVADEFMESGHPMLKCESGKELKPHIRRVEVDFLFQTLIENENLGLTCRFRKNVANNCSHIEIYSENTILTINYIQYKRGMARNAKFRKFLADGTQLEFFYETDENIRNDHKEYAQLIYGGDKSLDFIILGIPDLINKTWNYKISLLDDPFIIKENPPEEAAIKLKLKEYLKENIDGN
jgi:hypothetical protein